ncbi:hypothetical protein EVAR_16573_1 [Eumeta japonica]|uniref:Uncharacterized protein n=1 Tax=Eumeta variegata TaxID=151549 RepID=A0A4C1U352_EUMVA|nr:hypothetical protein EVAR_16573_1 [Eumeta japonica]
MERKSMRTSVANVLMAFQEALMTTLLLLSSLVEYSAARHFLVDHAVDKIVDTEENMLRIFDYPGQDGHSGELSCLKRCKYSKAAMS